MKNNKLKRCSIWDIQEGYLLSCDRHSLKEIERVEGEVFVPRWEGNLDQNTSFDNSKLYHVLLQTT